MKFRLWVLAAVILGGVSCQKAFLGDDMKSTPRDNFQELWKTLDQKYSFFNYICTSES